MHILSSLCDQFVMTPIFLDAQGRKCVLIIAEPLIVLVTPICAFNFSDRVILTVFNRERENGIPPVFPCLQTLPLYRSPLLKCPWLDSSHEKHCRNNKHSDPYGDGQDTEILIHYGDSCLDWCTNYPDTAVGTE